MFQFCHHGYVEICPRVSSLAHKRVGLCLRGAVDVSVTCLVVSMADVAQLPLALGATCLLSDFKKAQGRSADTVDKILQVRRFVI